MMYNKIELRVFDCVTSDSVNLGLYDHFCYDLIERIEFLLNADCEITLRPIKKGDVRED